MNLKSGFLTLNTSDGEMEVYFSHLENIKNPSVVIILQESYGVNEHIKDVCHRFSQEGYFVFSPELYHRSGRNIQFDYADKGGMRSQVKLLTEDGITEDLVALMEMIREFPQVNHHSVAVVGFCVGGYSAMLAAARFEIQAAVSFYGAGTVFPREGMKLAPISSEFHNIECPLLLFFGREDSSIVDKEVSEIHHQLENLHKPFKSVVFENTGHGFFCDQRSSYQPESAREAWEITLEFLKETLNHSSIFEARSSRPLEEDSSRP